MTAAALVAAMAVGLTSPASAQGRNDVLVIGMATSDLISMDPAKAFEFSGIGIIAQIYDRLLDFPPGNSTAAIR
jgi:peptide/nickel transport system substrate-binding protein